MNWLGFWIGMLADFTRILAAAISRILLRLVLLLCPPTEETEVYLVYSKLVWDLIRLLDQLRVDILRGSSGISVISAKPSVRILSGLIIVYIIITVDFNREPIITFTFDEVPK